MKKIIDWPILQKNIIILIVVSLLSYALYYFVTSYSERVSGNYAKEQKAFTAAEKKYRLAEKNRTLYKQYLSSYREFYEKGLIGEEQRLSWIEELEALNKRMALPKLSYSINPTQEIKLPHIKNRNRNIQVNVSEMKVQAGLLHEGDFLTILDSLKENANGFYSLKKCSIKSKFDKKIKQYSPRSPYVDVDCDLDWLTVKVEN